MGAMADGLEARIAEAAAAVEALRRESEHLDKKIDQKRLQADSRQAEEFSPQETELRPATGVSVQDVPDSIFWSTLVSKPCAEQIPCDRGAETCIAQTPNGLLHFQTQAADAAVSPNYSADKWLPNVQSTVCQVANAHMLSPVPSPPSQCQKAGMDLGQPDASITRQPDSAAEASSVDLQDPGGLFPTISPLHAGPLPADLRDDWKQQEQLEIGVERAHAQPNTPSMPVPPSAPAPASRPPRRVQTRPKQPRPLDFPSDEAVASMSRRERIALLEGVDGSSSTPSYADALGHQAASCESTLPLGADNRGIAELLHNAFGSGVEAYDAQSDPSTLTFSTGASSTHAHTFHQTPVHETPREQAADDTGTRSEASRRESSLARRRRLADEQSRAPVADFPSDEVVAQMSRRERIALLERAEGGSSVGDETPRRRRDFSATRRREDSSARCREDSVRRQLEPRARGSSQNGTPDQESLSQPSADDGLDDEAWLEQRRQNRKMRLQRPPRTESTPIAGVESQIREHRCAQDSEACELQRAAQVERRRPIRNTSEAGANLDAVHGDAADGRSLMEELDDVARLSIHDARWVPLCANVSANAHKLSSGGLVRAIQVVAGVAAAFPMDSRGSSSDGMVAFRSAVDAVLVNITPQLGSLNTSVIADALWAMVGVNIQEQSYLDMLLVQLLVLLRRERQSFTPGMLASFAGAIGALHSIGVSAKRASSGASSAANKRCLDTLSEQIAAVVDNFEAPELGKIGGAYLVAFTDDVLRRALLARAAELGAGLVIGSTRADLGAMQEIEKAVRQHSFAFIASLPDQTKDYLTKLKAAAPPDLSAD